jgi:light-regulated signal transduction histidine kinase (bacteriophytochrome)
MMDKFAAALANCDKEPVHVPGRIQGFGTLLGFDAATERISHAGRNLPEMIPTGQPTVAPILGRQIDELLPPDLMHSVRNAIGLPTIETQRERIGTFGLGPASVDLAAFRSAETVVLEIEPVQKQQQPAPSIARIRSMLASLDTGTNISVLADSAVRALRSLTGYDRVMCYQFLAGGEGEVIAEARGPDIEPYLGLRYPASDIPKPVRDIMLRAPFRVIHDIADPHSELVAAAGKSDLDLSLAHLRGVSPVHVQYLSNMGVSATMNASIVVHASLWGLFAFHHYSPRKLSPDHRSICEIFGHLISLQFQQQLERESLKHRRRANSTLASIRENAGGDLNEEFVLSGAGLLEAAQADGAALLSGGSVKTIGETPAADLLAQIADQAGEDFAAIDSLIAIGIDVSSDPARTAGALVFPLSSGDASAQLIFLRNEVINEVRWAGRPDKTITDSPYGPRLTPRASFEEYRESVAGRCAPWSRANIEAASEIRRAILEIMYRDAPSADAIWQKQKAQQDLLIAELHHRVRNVLALVQSIARQTVDSSVSLERYVESFQERIEALAQAHDLVGGSALQWPRLDRLVRAELAPYASSPTNIRVDGPALAVRADMAPVLALVLHEAATNAAKHGALSEKGESLDVVWSEDAGGVTLDWQEHLRQPLLAPSRRGFGLSLLERAIPHECGGEARISFEDGGLRLTLWLPAEAVRRAATAEPAPAEEPTAPAKAINAGRRVLVLEDNAVLATELESMLRGLGATTVIVGATTTFGRQQLQSRTFDVAVLDANLRAGKSFELARAIRAAGIPVVIVSGYDAAQIVPDDLTDLPWLTKPIGAADLSRVLDMGPPVQ